ncbi:MAG: cyclic pyranopterin monophosphate synthase MoaC [Pirellulales bacterium]|nr:cyclic pyranopterin monophosphate synthase MoaC [Pirellulales bacterium]
MPNPLTHFDDAGASRMVDVGNKPVSPRRAVAAGFVRMQPATLAAILDRDVAKGDVCEVARLAGIMAAKRTGELIPLCHPLSLDAIAVELAPEGDDALRITATVATTARTGVEMEALTAVSVAALTVYDMCKSLDRRMTIEAVQLVSKSGGASGEFAREATFPTTPRSHDSTARGGAP